MPDCHRRGALRIVSVLAGLLLAGVFTSPSAAALPKVSASLGQGVVLDGGAHATGVQGELVASYSFLMLQADLGYIYQFNKEHASILTPGLRVNVVQFYARAGLPLRLDEQGEWGVRLGAGYHLFCFGVGTIFLEIDGMFWEEVEFTKAVPLAGRIGVEFGF